MYQFQVSRKIGQYFLFSAGIQSFVHYFFILDPADQFLLIEIETILCSILLQQQVLFPQNIKAACVPQAASICSWFIYPSLSCRSSPFFFAVSFARS